MSLLVYELERERVVRRKPLQTLQGRPHVIGLVRVQLVEDVLRRLGGAVRESQDVAVLDVVSVLLGDVRAGIVGELERVLLGLGERPGVAQVLDDGRERSLLVELDELWHLLVHLDGDLDDVRVLDGGHRAWL